MSEPVPATRRAPPSSGLDWPLIAGLALVFLGWGWHRVSASELQWLVDDRWVEPLRRMSAVQREWWAEALKWPDAGSRVLGRAICIWAGQFDPRVEWAINVMAWAAAWSTVWAVVLRKASISETLWLAVLGLGIVLCPANVETLTSFRALDGAWAVVFTGAYVLASTGGPRTGATRGFGLLAGLLGVLGSNAAAAAPCVVLGWLWVRQRQATQKEFGFRAEVLANGVLAVLAVLTVWIRWPEGAGAQLLRIGASPGANGLWLLVLNAPMLGCLVRWLIAKESDPRHDRLAAAALWGVGLWLGSALAGPLDQAEWRGVVAVMALINGACGLYWVNRTQVTPAGWLKLGAIAVVLVTYGRVKIETTPMLDPALAAGNANAILKYWENGDSAAFRRTYRAPEPTAKAVLVALQDPGLRPWWPTRVRAPLKLVAEGEATAAVAPMAGEEVFSLSGAGALRWRSLPFQSESELIQLPIAGTFDPPRLAVRVRMADGTVLVPTDRRKVTGEEWRGLNFWVPKGRSLRLEVERTSPEISLRWRNPRELSVGGWVAGKVLATGPWMLGLGVAILVGLGWRRLDQVRWRSVETGEKTRWADITPLLMGACALVFVSDSLDLSAGGADSSGYLNSAKLLAAGRLQEPLPRIQGMEAYPEAFSPLGFHVAGGGMMSPAYPPGLPLLIAGARWCFEPARATAWVMMVHLAAALWVMWSLARETGYSQRWSWLAAAALGLSPAFVYVGLQPLSDVVSLAWAGFAVLAAWKSLTKARWIGISGVAFSVAVLIRPTNLLAAVPVLMVIGVFRWRTVAWCTAGLPAAIWLLWYNHRVHGSPWASGYGRLEDLFDWRWGLPTALHYLKWLPLAGAPVMLFAPFGLGSPALPRRTRWTLAAWAGVFLVFYAFYFCTRETWWYLRFLLPAFPPLILLGVAGLQRVLERAPGCLEAKERMAPKISLLVSLGVFAWSVAGLSVLAAGEGDKVYEECAHWVNTNVRPEGLVVCAQVSGALHYYSPAAILDYEALPPERMRAALRGAKRLNRPVYLMLFPSEESNAWFRMDGLWREESRVRDVRVWRLDPDSLDQTGQEKPLQKISLAGE